ncbi:MAG TPA: hypothetical protein VIM70_16215 [Clostridium sp.]|uniref:hypothetical protein n=1 Tax=Clostridium sp. TaxID=1506 RepID=UPI002F94FB34
MAITREEFIPRPGIVNKEGQLPDPDELVCVEIPKVFDECLIKRCIVYNCGPDTAFTDKELRGGPIKNPKTFLRCSDFKLTLISVEKIPLKNNSSYKKIIVCFQLSFYAYFLNCNGENVSEYFEINRTEIIPKLYCPDSIAQISSTLVPTGISSDFDSEIIKLEMVTECLDGIFSKDDECNDFLDITLGYHLIVKCELIVQLLIPAYGYCPVPKQCEEEPEEDPCEKFNREPVPKFFPDQKLKPLFDFECDN